VELTRQADYALRCVLEVARHGRLSAGQIAARQQLSPSFVGKIVSSLAHAGVLETYRGAAGGVQLGRPPDAITVLEVVEAVQGPIRLNRCVRTPAACAIVDRCVYAPVLREAQDALTGALSVTLDELLARDRELEGAGPAATSGATSGAPSGASWSGASPSGASSVSAAKRAAASSA
jgi:Rrf2 family protein